MERLDVMMHAQSEGYASSRPKHLVPNRVPDIGSTIRIKMQSALMLAFAFGVGFILVKLGTDKLLEKKSDSSNRDSSSELVVLDAAPSGWVTDDDGTNRYYDPETHKYYSGWLDEEDETLYIDGDTGTPHIGWLDLNGKRYWFDDSSGQNRGVLLKDQWLSTGDEEYYLGPDGSAFVGWAEIEDRRYYFNESGAVQTGWIDDGSGKRYWIRPEDGTIPSHEWIEIDGVFQAFDDDGSWVNDGDILPPGDAENVANMSARQKAVIEACDITPWPGKGLCAGWVSSVFVNAGEPAVGGDACDIARTWCTSSDLSELKPGMVIAVPTHERTDNGRIWGHVCIYAGNGLVRDSGADSTRWVTLGSWFAWYGTLESPRWGWANGIPLTS